MSVSETDSFLGNYFSEITLLMTSAKDPKKAALLVAKSMSNEYSHEIFESFAALQNLHKEISSILDEFSGRSAFLIKLITIDLLVLSIKFYVIAWSTMLDLAASLVSKVFNLGISEKDINIDLILRNKHVQKTEVFTILKSYTKQSDYDLFRHHRNEIIHRGKIIDDEVVQLQNERNHLFSKRFSLLNTEPISDEEFQKENEQLTAKIRDLASSKQTSYKAHYARMAKILSDLMAPLAHKAFELYGGGVR